MRPQSIIWFERLYIAALLLGLVAAVLSWSMQAAMLNSDPRLANLSWLPYAALVLRIVIAVALWYFVARQGSVVAKWIVAVLAVYSAVLLLVLLYGLVAGSASASIVLPSALQNILYIAAAATLFRADTRSWFGEDKRVETAA